jgi:hypothetical protein
LFFVIAGLFVGYFMSNERDVTMRISPIIGTAIALFLFSGVVSLFSVWLAAKGKLA